MFIKRRPRCVVLLSFLRTIIEQATRFRCTLPLTPTTADRCLYIQEVPQSTCIRPWLHSLGRFQTSSPMLHLFSFVFVSFFPIFRFWIFEDLGKEQVWHFTASYFSETALIRHRLPKILEISGKIWGKTDNFPNGHWTTFRVIARTTDLQPTALPKIKPQTVNQSRIYGEEVLYEQHRTYQITSSFVL